MRVAAPSAVPHTNGCIREMPRLRACHEVLSGVPPRASAVAAGMRDRNRDAQHKVRRRDDHVAGHPHDIDGHIVDHRQGEWETSTATSLTMVRASGRHRRPHRRPLSGRVGSTAEKKKKKPVRCDGSLEGGGAGAGEQALDAVINKNSTLRNLCYFKQTDLRVPDAGAAWAGRPRVRAATVRPAEIRAM
jgi:hypothetical protein